MSKSQERRWFPRLSRLAASVTAVASTMASVARAADVCAAGPRIDASLNAASFSALPVTAFGRLEIGWNRYAPLIGAEIGSPCAATSPGFAAALARWRAAHRLEALGVVDGATLSVMRQVWLSRRPFVAVSKAACPAPPAESSLATASVAESYGGKTITLRPGALAAYRRLTAAARRVAPIAADRRLLTLFSGYRSPAYDAVRCAREGNCQGVVRAACSPHRTGLAMDLYLGEAPGHRPDSSDDANRLYLSNTTAYRWLVTNAGRFGFVNYSFEPWHWEWTGEPP